MSKELSPSQFTCDPVSVRTKIECHETGDKITSIPDPDMISHQCFTCKKLYKNLICHLKKKKSCQTSYNMQMIE